MRILCALAVVLAASTLSPAAVAQTDPAAAAKLAAATAEAERIGRRDPAGEAAARMKIAERLIETDPKAATAMVTAARAASIRAEGADGPMVALADYRLALIRALGGDRAGQLRPMGAAAQRIAGAARTPAHRTLAAQALIVAASFTMSSGEPALTDGLRDGAIAILDSGDLARNRELAEAYRVVGDVLIFQNRPAEALPWADRSIALYRQIDPDDDQLIYALARRGSALLRLSRYAEALADLRAAVTQSDRSRGDDPVAGLYAVRALGHYYWRLAEPDLALPLFKRAMVEAEKLPPGFPYAGGVSRDIMQLLLDAGRFDEARDYAEDAVRRARTNMGANGYEYGSSLLTLAKIDLEQGDDAAAAGRIDEADAIFDRGLDTGNTRRFEPLAARGLLLAARGRSIEATALLERARALLAHMPADDIERIDLAQASAAAQLAGGGATSAGWTAARAAADGLTTRVIRQVSGIGAIDSARERSDRVFGTALAVAWAQGAKAAGGR